MTSKERERFPSMRRAFIVCLLVFPILIFFPFSGAVGSDRGEAIMLQRDAISPLGAEWLILVRNLRKPTEDFRNPWKT
jgi:hypothetical protein